MLASPAAMATPEKRKKATEATRVVLNFNMFDSKGWLVIVVFDG